MTKTEWTKIGEVGVDSGSLMISDPCYLTNENWSDKDYDKEVCSDWDLFKQIKGENGSLKAVLFGSGLGDGVYGVYAKIKEYKDFGKRITEVKIKLL